MNNTIYFLTTEIEEKICREPYRAWERYSPNKLMIEGGTDDSHNEEIENILCYSANSLYVLVKSNQSDIVHRDRAYQNGDGFHFVLASPKDQNAPSEEFYVIGISPLAPDRSKKFIWYKNIDLAMKALKNTSVKHIKYNNNTYFMVQIPWDEIYPLKPFLFKSYGFNISYVQAVEEKSNVFMLLNDDKIQSEQSLRKYVVYKFEDPITANGIEYSFDFNRRNCCFNQELILKIAINSPLNEEVYLELFNNKELLIEKKVQINQGLNRFEIPILTNSFKECLYNFEVKLCGSNINIVDNMKLYFYDMKSIKKLEHKILNLADNDYNDNFIDESIVSLKFKLENIYKKINKLNPYDDFDPILNLRKDLENEINEIEKGKNIFKTGEILRLGFKSTLDKSIQPYSIYIPNVKDSKKDYKLLVYLHGSGDDDRSLKYSKMLLKFADEYNVIVLAPFARGTSNYYCPLEARRDIKELTEKIKKIYRIKDNNVYLSGFSMGGYGVYRIYDDIPHLFNGLMVLSGHPGLGSHFGGPDYCDDEKINRFKDIPIIIFHGTEDRNCSYEEAKEFFSKIKKVNQICQINITEGRGHSGLTEDWYKILVKWFDNTTKSRK